MKKQTPCCTRVATQGVAAETGEDFLMSKEFFVVVVVLLVVGPTYD